MHEMSIAVELLQQLETLALEHGADHVDDFAVTAGAMRGIVPEALDIAFESIAKGTLAEGAKLKLEIIPVIARCKQCDHQFPPGEDSFLCELCNQADVDIIQGNEIVLSSVTAHKQDEGSTDEN